MVLMVYTAVDQVLVVNPCGANGLHSAVDRYWWLTLVVLMVYTVQSVVRYWWLTLVVLMVNPCGAAVGLHSVHWWLTLVVLMVYTVQSNQVLVVNPCGANGLHLHSVVDQVVDQVLVDQVNPCGADGLHSAVDQVLVVNPCGANGLHCSRSGTGG